ncbi:DNA repair protein [Niveomyces insectorum RCEF 264]|uniref:DNA repair protein n=1 Tax=Niveomyces insectorum RCEF 264 TaxID=1081102 RepID=A0A167XNA2_9HYPO|nr:DNA repair protein [Niveomyces insectorum RCEF 264]
MDDFSDDGIDDWNVALLQELENEALQSFQSFQPKQAQRSPFRHNAGATATTNTASSNNTSNNNNKDLFGKADAANPISIDDDNDNDNDDDDNGYGVNQADAAVLRELARVPAQHSLGGRLAAAAAPPPLALPAYSQQNVVNAPLSTVNNNTNSRKITVKPAYYHSVTSTQRRAPVGGLPPRNNNVAAPARALGAHAAPTASAAAQPRPAMAASSYYHANHAAAAAATRSNAPAATTTTNTATAVTATTTTTIPAGGTNSATTLAALQARVRTLETDLLTANGQASMLRDKYVRALGDHRQEVARIEKEKDEELAKQRQMAEAAVAAHQSAATELAFAQQDLREEVERSKKGRRADQRAEGGGGGPVTPRKNTAGRSHWDVADGFDNVELLPSPSKGFGRRLKDATGAVVPAVERTPTKGKRRRPVTSSPAKPLETLAVDADVPDSPPPGTIGGDAGAVSLPGESTKQAKKEELENPLVFLQEVLGHQNGPDQPTTIELFSRYAFPSNRKQTLSFLMLQRIPKLEAKQGTTRLMLDFCQLILGIWSQCLREVYYAPVRALVSLLSYIITRDPNGLAPHLLVSLYGIAQKTIYLVGAPAFNTPGSTLDNHPDYAVRQLACEIDAGAIMSLLRLMALGCLSPAAAADKLTVQPHSPHQPSQASAYPDLSMSSQARFWGVVQFEFMLLMVSSKQSPEAFLGMLALLRTSALPDSIGPITNDPNRDTSVVASVLIDRISHHIEEPPKWASSSKYTVWDVRLSALGVLDCFAQSPFGRLSLAASECALPRLVDALFAAYKELRNRDLLQEPLYGDDDQLMLPESRVREYGIGGFDLVQTLGPRPGPTHEQAAAPTAVTDTPTTSERAVGSTSGAGAGSGMPPLEKGKGDGDGDGDDDGGDADNHNIIPLVLLFVSSAVYLLHSIVTDPFTAPVANIPAKLAETRGGMQNFYLLTMARLGFRADPAFAVGLGEETHQLALELFKLAATPDEDKDYTAWAQQGHSGVDNTRKGQADPFADYVPGDRGDETSNGTTNGAANGNGMVKVEKTGT